MSDRLKSEEKALRRTLESLNDEFENKSSVIKQLEGAINSAADEIELRKDELESLNRKLEEYAKEKEVYRKNKLENVHLVKEVAYIEGWSY